MASISKEPNGRRTVQFVGADGKRRSIRLGKCDQRTAEAVKVRVEALNAANIAGHVVDANTLEWLTTIGDDLAGKLAAVGLVARRGSATLGAFLSEYVSRRVDVKPATKEVWGQVVRNLLDCFGDGRAIATIDDGAAEDFKMYLVGQGLAPTTVHKRLQFARGFFRAAMKRKLVRSNPFAEVSARATMKADRERFITEDETDRLLAACPNVNWRVIVSLCRYGGLRCPSEVLSLKWQHVDWERERILVQSPKTEHHPGKATREIPLFPELRPALEEAFDVAREGAEYVVGGGYRQAALSPSGWRHCNLRTQFERIVRRAGLDPWSRLFHALRASRETELAREYPIHVVTSWLGNTPRIAMKHYLMVTDSDFRKAVQNPVHNMRKSVQIPVQQPAASSGKGPQETMQPFENQGLVLSGARPCETLPESLAERTGFEPAEPDTDSRI